MESLIGVCRWTEDLILGMEITQVPILMFNAVIKSKLDETKGWRTMLLVHLGSVDNRDNINLCATKEKNRGA